MLARYDFDAQSRESISSGGGNLWVGVPIANFNPYSLTNPQANLVKPDRTVSSFPLLNKSQIKRYRILYLK